MYFYPPSFLMTHEVFRFSPLLRILILHTVIHSINVSSGAVAFLSIQLEDVVVLLYHARKYFSILGLDTHLARNRKTVPVMYEMDTGATRTVVHSP